MRLSVPSKATLAALGATVLGVTTLVACSDYVDVRWNGLVGISHDGHGHVTVHVNTCENSTSTIFVEAIPEKRRDGEKNQVIGRFTSEKPMSGYFEMKVDDPAPWQVSTPLSLPTDPAQTFIFHAEVGDKGGPQWLRPINYFDAVASNGAELFKWAPGKIVVDYDEAHTNGSMTVDEFKAACGKGVPSNVL